MKSSNRFKRLALATLAVLPQLASGHSWVERVMRIAPNGTMTGTPGYERSHAVRGQISEDDIVWLLPPNGRPDGKVIHTDDKIAKPVQRPLNASSYTSQFGMAKAAPGDYIALQYQENGHVTLPAINPYKTLNAGTVYVYGTNQSDLTNTNLVDVHFSWTADGTGGDKKGRLLATRNFDDGQCYQINSNITSAYRQASYPKQAQDPMGGDLWCQSDIQIPEDVSAGQVYTMIWVWDWPTMSIPGVPVPPASFYANSSKSGVPYVTTPQLYTSVIDIQVVDPCDASLGSVKSASCSAGGSAGGSAGHKNAVAYVKQTNLNVGGNRAQLQSPFQVAVPQGNAQVAAASEALTDIPMYTTYPASFLAKFDKTATFSVAVTEALPGVPTASPAAPVSNPSSPTADGGEVTVTVTETVPLATVFITEVVTAGATQTVQGRDLGVAAVTSDPFAPSKKLRRGPGEWALGQN